MLVSPRSFHPFTSSFSKPSVTAPSDFPDKRRTKKKTVKRRKVFFRVGPTPFLLIHFRVEHGE